MEKKGKDHHHPAGWQNKMTKAESIAKEWKQAADYLEEITEKLKEAEEKYEEAIKKANEALKRKERLEGEEVAARYDYYRKLEELAAAFKEENKKD